MTLLLRRIKDKIAAHVEINLEIQPAELDNIFADVGGWLDVKRVLGDNWHELVAELKQVVAA